MDMCAVQVFNQSINQSINQSPIVLLEKINVWAAEKWKGGGGGGGGGVELMTFGLPGW
jgi:hypothetical protein